MGARASVCRGWWVPPMMSVLILGMMAILPCAAAESKAAAKTEEAENYKLTVVTMNKVENAYREFAAVAKADPTVAEHLAALEPDDASGEPILPSVDETVRQLETVPQFVKAAKNAGTTIRELVLFNYALMGTVMAEALGGAGNLPDSGESPALAANLKWYRENQDAVQRYFAVMDEVFPDEESTDAPAEDWTTGEADTSAAEE